MRKKVIILILGALVSLLIGFGIGMVVQNGGFSGLFGGKEEETAVDMTGKIVTVGQNTANVYEKADANSAVIYSMGNGETATCLKQSDTWLKLEIIDGVYGYAHASLFTLASEYQIAADKENTSTEQETAPTKSYVTPTVNVLDIYKGESTDFAIVDTVEAGAILELVKKDTTWSKVATLEGKEGYVLTSDIKTTDYDPEAVVVTVVHSFVNLRAEPSADSEKLGSLNEGDTATFLGEEDGFYHIRTEDGTEGYVSMDYTQKTNPTADGESTDSDEE